MPTGEAIERIVILGSTGSIGSSALVVAGPGASELARSRGALVVAVDSEHAAVFQALRAGEASEVRRVILTSSGGPFRGRPRQPLATGTPDHALCAPTARMGRNNT